jgi:hypothetical protein
LSAKTYPIILTLALILIMPQVLGKVDPETKRLRLVLFGEGWSLTPHIFMTDPKVAVVVIPAGDATFSRDMERLMRIYMPRTYEEWVDNVDIFMLSDLVPWGFSDTHFLWMRDSIEEEGTGMMLSEMGWYGIGGWTGNAAEDWAMTMVYDAYPTDMLMEKQNQDCSFLTLVDVPQDVLDVTGPLLDLPGFEQVAFANEQGIHDPRPGATTWAKYRCAGEAAIVSRPYGKGMAIANSMGIERFVQPYYEWKYYKDYFINHAYLAGSVRVPEELELVHRVREQLETFRDERSFVIAMIDFIDKFNANTRPVEKMLAEATPMRKEAEDLFVDQKYEESAQLLETASERFDEINEAATKLRDQALLWVYVIEWSAVSATALFTGIIVWSLMVRRRLYREVGLTRRGGT